MPDNLPEEKKKLDPEEIFDGIFASVIALLLLITLGIYYCTGFQVLLAQ